MSKHTPGPWTNEENEITAEDGSVICSVHTVDDFPCIEQDNTEAQMKLLLAELDANASLIVSAPELYEAGKGVLALFDNLTIRPHGDHDNPNTDPAYIVAFGEFKRLRDAIAKAEGK